MESFENEWGHEMEEFDWMGPTKNAEDYQNLEENEVSVCSATYCDLCVTIQFCFQLLTFSVVVPRST